MMKNELFMGLAVLSSAAFAQSKAFDVLGVSLGDSPTKVASALIGSGHKSVSKTCHYDPGSPCAIKLEVFNRGTAPYESTIRIVYSQLAQQVVEIERNEVLDKNKPTLAAMDTALREKYGTPAKIQPINNTIEGYWVNVRSGKANLNGKDYNCLGKLSDDRPGDYQRFISCSSTLYSYVVIDANPGLALSIKVRATDFEKNAADYEGVQSKVSEMQNRSISEAQKVKPKL